MLGYIVFVSILYLVNGFTFKGPDPVCSRNDLGCLEEEARLFFKTSLSGIKELGVVPLEPLHHDLIETKEHGLESSLLDSIVKGFKDIVVNGVTITNDNKNIKMNFDLTLPVYEMSGKYKMTGKLINIPVTGEGDYVFKTTNIHVLFTATKEFYEKNGKKHMKLKDMKTHSELLGPIYFNIQNLFGGNKALAGPVLKFINDNQKIVAELWQDRVTMANMNVVLDNFNKILAVVPLEELVKHE